MEMQLPSPARGSDLDSGKATPCSLHSILIMAHTLPSALRRVNVCLLLIETNAQKPASCKAFPSPFSPRDCNPSNSGMGDNLGRGIPVIHCCALPPFGLNHGNIPSSTLQRGELRQWACEGPSGHRPVYKQTSPC